MNDRVLVTGARGFIGRALVKALRAASFAVLEHSTEQGDIARCELRYSGVGRVFHLAGRSFVPDSWIDTHAFYETNVLGTVNVLEFCRKHKAALTLISSYVYGRPRILPIAETHTLQAVNPYAHTKIMAEDAARYYATQYGVHVSIVRPFNIYGPGQAERFLIPTLLRQALDPKLEFITVADLRPRRDYLHIDDLTALLMTTTHGPPETYNAGSGVSWSVAELIEIINSFLPKPKTARSCELVRPNEIPDVRADISLATCMLGWRPAVELRDGIGQMIATWRDH